MKEEFKNRWLELLIFLILTIISAIYVNNPANDVDSRIEVALLCGVCAGPICDFFARNMVKLIEKNIEDKRNKQWLVH